MSRHFPTLALVTAVLVGSSAAAVRAAQAGARGVKPADTATAATAAGAPAVGAASMSTGGWDAASPPGPPAAAPGASASGSQAEKTVTAVALGLAILAAVVFGVRIGVRRRAARPAGGGTPRPVRPPLPAVHRRRWISGLAVACGVAVGGPFILVGGLTEPGASQRAPAYNRYRDTAAPPAAGAAGALAQDLAGSPGPLAELHGQASELLGTDAAFKARLRALRGYPVVVNVWASWCTPCRSEFSLFAAASVQHGRHVAFLGADTDDAAGDARSFLTQHPVSYPSYQTSESSLSLLAVLEGLPTTIYLNPAGKVVHVHIGQYGSEAALDQDIRSYVSAG
jgi:cytochrome c biogenesis protein CcmG/thiol:disulfide interchange protein DsbE